MVVLLTMLATGVATDVYLSLSAGEKQIRFKIEHEFAVADPQFMQSMGALLGPAVMTGNTVTALQNGEQIFPAMLEAIRSAQRSISFETYIYWSGEIGRQFTDALCERARNGVKVHVLLDWVGSSRIDDDDVARLEAAGAQIERYHPLHWYTLARLNHRTHRKILVVDGQVGFTGGVGIADQWEGHAQDSQHWRDSHFRVEGPAVAQLQAAFVDNWIKTRAQVLRGEDYFPRLEPQGDKLAQVFRSSQSEGSESVRLMYLLAMASATKEIRLSAAYFVPDDLAVETFVAARQRGVDVEIILPGPKTDSALTQQASRSRWGELLDAGVEIYEYQPTMFHCKVMVVDGLFVSVGSTNFDDRSFRLNDEANLNVYDADFAREQLAVFEADKRNSKQVTRPEFEDRSQLSKTTEALAGSIRRLL